ncbi:pantoate/beta-alanine ligase [Ammonifex degensii KC4]|uniref:Pantothenate synthetase n=1 Tax=Ammonifex degensii (strain DSM 10501 / KC4) TaxID=429009 RepID=C9R9H8_AMMDK|nr:pantoate--beta-alanine ligase [Ammonifex degensii]ACX52957.1 pantoate/beta-alanine ligase [Ammonifex degensii KC4]
MKVVKRLSDLRSWVAATKARGEKIGFVPTMGFLHEGHLALIRQARSDQEVDRVVVSIFVNPLQFGPREDYREYPRDLERDRRLVEEAGADLLFAPSVEEMYPSGFATYVEVTGQLTSVLCGRSRPGHFRGVATVVAKLFNLVCPDCAYFGLKDAQQVAVIKRMVEDLNFPVKIKVHPTVREADGLALSSRNTYLSPEERKAATVLFRALKEAEEAVKAGEREARVLQEKLSRTIQAEPLARLDYAEIVSWPDLEPATVLLPGMTYLLAVAAYFGRARLIDNLLVEVQG